MKQAEKISNNFSDAYLLALLEGNDAEEVLRRYAKEFPELVSQINANADSLNLMYGNLLSEVRPSDNEIASAYKKVSEKLQPAVTAHAPAAKPRLNFFGEVRRFFSASPMWSGASLGITAAVIIALLWQPWMIKHSDHGTAENHEATTEQNNISGSQDIAGADQHSPDADPAKMPEVQYRGKNVKQTLSAAQKKIQDSIDAARLKQLATPKPLTAPAGLYVEPLVHGQVMVTWKPVEGALSYIVEMKAANDDSYDPVTQISQTGARVTSLESGKTYFVRVIAVSGERKGPASDAKSIVVP